MLCLITAENNKKTWQILRIDKVALRGERPTLFTVGIFTERDHTFTETGRKIHWLLCFLFVFEKRHTTAFQVIKALNKQTCFAKPVNSIEIRYLSYI